MEFNWASLHLNAKNNNVAFKPLFFRLNNYDDRFNFNELINGGNVLFIHDELEGQLRELIKSEHPSVKLTHDDYDDLIAKRLGGEPSTEYGVWVYYPWSLRLVHILDEIEFIELRTNRNQHKITRAERDSLKEKTIGIVGLSVGQSIALTIAMERICGEMRLADFDAAELSNLNRLRTGIHNLGLPKTIIAAREIAELDPFLKVYLFNDGLTSANMDEFFAGRSKLDLFIEVCDGLDIKIQSRFKARELQIPVVMDTNDRGMLDVERFDLEPGRPLLHGLIGEIDPADLKNLPMTEKLPIILRMVGIEAISPRMKSSMMEIDQTITTWPQLASSVTLGGALTTDVCRRILLDQFHESGRYYVDFDQLIKDESLPEKEIPANYLAPAELAKDDMLNMVADLDTEENGLEIEESDLLAILHAAILAPSGGNAQPWKFLYKNGHLFIFHDDHFSYSLLDYNNLGSYLSIGAVVENIAIKAAALGFEIFPSYFPLAGNKKMVAMLTFNKATADIKLAALEKGLYTRHTNRNSTVRPVLNADIYTHLKIAISGYKGAEFKLIDDPGLMTELGDILATAEMLRILHPRGHYDTFTNELRWTKEENELKRDGLDIETLGVSANEAVALKVAKNAESVAMLRKIGGGAAFKKMVNKAVSNSSALGIVYMPGQSDLDFITGGRAVERIWIEANMLNLSFQPITQLVYLLARLGKELPDLDTQFVNDLQELKERFNRCMPGLTGRQPVFIFRLGEAGEPVKSLRRPLSSFFYHINS